MSYLGSTIRCLNFKKVVSSLALISVIGLTAVQASAAKYKFDTVHSQILFSATHMGFSHSHGSFVDFDGTLEFDEKNIEKSKVSVTIQTDSINLNDDTWNSHMKDKKWFNVIKFPEMTFESTKVIPTGDKTFDLQGNLKLLGVSKPVTLNVTLNKVGPFFGKEKAGFSAIGTIKRTDFGMKAFVPNISDEIPIRIEVEAVKEK